jgi:ParB/RepB/Spo0J family partition protein
MTTTAPIQNNNTPHKTDFTRDNIVNIKLSDIKVDPNWNSRSQHDLISKGTNDDDYTGIEGLIESIKANGQDTPVDVVKNTSGGKQPFFLVAGFRRYEAIRRIADAQKNLDTATIRAVVKELNPLEMRLLNLRENTARDNLKGADLAKGIEDLMALNPKLTQTEIGLALNRSQPYVGKLIKINSSISKDIRDHWRNTPGNPVTVGEMYTIAGKDPKEHKAVYDASFKPAEGQEKKPGDWVNGAKRKAEQLGTLFGNLSRLHQIDFDSCLEDDFLGVLEDTVKLPETAKSRVKKALAKNMKDAYVKARDLQDTEETEEESDEE